MIFMSKFEREVFCILDIQLLAFFCGEFTRFTSFFNLPQPGKSGWSHKTINVFITSQ